jgi:hypothetical protein
LSLREQNSVEKLKNIISGVEVKVVGVLIGGTNYLSLLVVFGDVGVLVQAENFRLRHDGEVAHVRQGPLVGGVHRNVVQAARGERVPENCHSLDHSKSTNLQRLGDDFRRVKNRQEGV